MSLPGPAGSHPAGHGPTPPGPFHAAPQPLPAHSSAGQRHDAMEGRDRLNYRSSPCTIHNYPLNPAPSRPRSPRGAFRRGASVPAALSGGPRGAAMAGLGLSERERAGCRALLELLHTDELLALTDTVTNRLVHPESRQEAIHAILVYSQNVEELLRRRKVYREIIFKYLAAQGIAVPPSSEKHLLIERVRQFWSGQLTAQAPEPGHRKPLAQSYGDRQKSPQDDIGGLGGQFCQWYFELLNSQHPLGVKSEETWGPQHFWEDAKLKFYYNTLEKNTEQYVGADMVSLRLQSLVKEECLLFNPNLHSNGLKCAMSPHGLVLVAVAGTVHRDNACLGVFEQIFGLISCPMRNNTWKIKLVNLKIVGQNALEPGMQIEAPSIKYESNQLQEFYDGNELTVFEPQKF